MTVQRHRQASIFSVHTLKYTHTVFNDLHSTGYTVPHVPDSHLDMRANKQNMRSTTYGYHAATCSLACDVKENTYLAAFCPDFDKIHVASLIYFHPKQARRGWYLRFRTAIDG
jgi:hypothetical protein